MGNLKTIISQTKSEMRRGLVVLTTLALLKEPHYGYSLIQTLENKGIPIEGNTLYPLLRRLAKQGLLMSEWETDGSKPRKYYRITDNGETVLKALKDTYKTSTQSLNYILGVMENE
ncbi:MAG TPA: PadR family transcriptional regulator [Candidatus Izemoplasmatales bacterium]|nr:PadR family transcriptional regulator [Candidatus Izemoplasmatales bacterium]